MKRLFKIEWNKIYFYKTTRIFTMIYLLMLLTIGVVLALINPTIGGVKLDIAKLGTFNFPDVWKNMTYIAAIAKIFIGVIVITNVTNEYANRTIKQNFIDGLSKKEFLKSKIMTNELFAVISTIFVFMVCLVLGLIFSDTTEDIWHGMVFIGAYFIKLSLFFSICLFLAILLKKTAFAFLGLIVLWIGEGIISTVEVSIKAAQAGGFDKVDGTGFFIANYLPLGTSSNLIAFPQIDIQSFVMGGTIFNYKTLDWSFVGTAAVYIVLFTFFSYRILKKRDL